MSIDKTLLKKLSILYVEDDETIRNELEQLLAGFFSNVYTAKDGKDGLLQYKKHKDNIDLILSDINMPILSGLDMVQAIRTENETIPVFFCTAFTDSEYLSEAIKLKVHEYVVKPIDIRNLLTIFSKLASIIQNELLFEEQTKELSLYKEILESNNIIIRTDLNMKISYVNDLFCKTSGFTKNELIGKDFKILKHSDTSSDIYKDIYSSISNNKSWHGVMKNNTKENGSINVDAYIMPRKDEKNNTIGSIAILRDITEELTKKREIQMALMKDKSDIFKKSKEGSAEQHVIINNLKNDITSIRQQLSKTTNEKNKFISTVEKYTVENRKLRTELVAYKTNAQDLEEKYGNSFKVAKENADLRLEVKKGHESLEELEDYKNNEIKQVNVKYEIEIDDLKEELSKLKEKMENMDSNEVLEQKLLYWKEKAKNESKRIEELEKQVLATGDKNFMSKIFG